MFFVRYFINYRSLNSDFTVDLGTGNLVLHHLDKVDWRVTLVQTGLDSMTGGRVKRLQPLIGNESFLLTYGDGVADIDLNALLEFHRSHKKILTITGVRPPSMFGEVIEKDGKVISFEEKPQTSKGLINGGKYL